MTRLTPKQRETLEEIRDEDVVVTRMRYPKSETWTWVDQLDRYGAGVPIRQTDMSARELKRLRLLETRDLIEMVRIDRWHDGFGWHTVFAVVITDAGVDALLPVLR